MEFYYGNKLILPEQILQSGQFHLLAKRLGYLGEADYCVNGFSFWPNIGVFSGFAKRTRNP